MKIRLSGEHVIPRWFNYGLSLVMIVLLQIDSGRLRVDCSFRCYEPNKMSQESLDGRPYLICEESASVDRLKA